MAVADLVPAAQRQAERFGVRAASAVDDLLADDHRNRGNLTIRTPRRGAGQAVRAGKHVWNEKPLTVDRPSAQALLAEASAAGVRVGCAPDTFLGSGLQHTRRRIEEGVAGTPLTALVLLQTMGPESWHPNPAFFFAPGAGPLFDMGPYYLTAVAQISAGGVPLARPARGPARPGWSGPVRWPPGDHRQRADPRQRPCPLPSGQSAVMIFSFDSAQGRTMTRSTGPTAPWCSGPEPVRRRPGAEAAVRRARGADRTGRAVLARPGCGDGPGDPG